MPDGGGQISHVGRRAAVGAVVGALLGFVAGWAIHNLVRDGGSAAGYELVGAVLGLVAGMSLGAFYGGALALGRHRGERQLP